MVLKSSYSWVYVIHIVFVASILYLSGHFGMILGKKAKEFKPKRVKSLRKKVKRTKKKSRRRR